MVQRSYHRRTWRCSFPVLAPQTTRRKMLLTLRHHLATPLEPKAAWPPATSSLFSLSLFLLSSVHSEKLSLLLSPKILLTALQCFSLPLFFSKLSTIQLAPQECLSPTLLPASTLSSQTTPPALLITEDAPQDNGLQILMPPVNLPLALQKQHMILHYPLKRRHVVEQDSSTWQNEQLHERPQMGVYNWFFLLFNT